MRFNYELIKEDVRKIGVAMVIGALLAGLLKNSTLFEIIYPLFGGYFINFCWFSDQGE